MLRWSRSSCMLCGHSSVDLVTETFRSTPTMQVTLQKLCSAVPASHKFDVNRVFKETTSREGSVFCLPCLSALHGGMSVVSQIICLEKRLKQMAGCIGKKLSYLEVTVGHGTHHQRTEDDIVKEKVPRLSVLPESKCPEDLIDSNRAEKFLTTDKDLNEPPQLPRRKLRNLSKSKGPYDLWILRTDRRLSPKPSTVYPACPSTSKSSSSLTSKAPGIPIPIKQTAACPTTDSDIEEFSQEPRRKLRKLSKGRVVTSSRKEVPRPSRAPPVSPSTTKSDSPLPSLTARFPGVENCPECDFSVDLRTPAQAKSSTQPVPHKTVETRRKRQRARYTLALHYRDNHMPNIKRTKNRSKRFQCPQCPHKSSETGKLAVHYFKIHVLENKAGPSNTKSDYPLPSLTARIPGDQNCPECNFSVDDRTQVKSSTQPHKTLDAWRVSTRYKLAIHYRDNHMPPESKPNVQRTKDGIKLFLCPQCPHKNTEPSKLAVHYFSIHVLENKTAPSKLSCPTQGCSYSVDIPVRRGIYTFHPPQRHVRQALAVHVLTEHDIPSSAIHTAANSAGKLRTTRNNKTPLFIITSNNQREYHCTRCPLTTRLPEKPSEIQYMEYRKNFLGHFYDSHLSLSV